LKTFNKQQIRLKNIWRHRIRTWNPKQLVEKQGGTISVTSKINEGATFSFTLSFKKTNAEIKTETMDLELDKENRVVKVLVVEDIKLNQLLMKIILDDFNSNMK
jgi:light-regulated signal transduction histidine kinase (bacteriophytochrome)